MTDDPTRLRDEGSAFLKKALASARADVPDPERAAALEARILPLLLPPPTPPTPPTPPPPPPPSPSPTTAPPSSPRATTWPASQSPTAAPAVPASTP